MRIRSGATTPTSPLMPSKVEGLDTLRWHVGRRVEDKSDVSWKACSLADRPASLLILSRPLPLCHTRLNQPSTLTHIGISDDPLISVRYCIDPYVSCSYDPMYSHNNPPRFPRPHSVFLIWVYCAVILSHCLSPILVQTWSVRRIKSSIYSCRNSAVFPQT